MSEIVNVIGCGESAARWNGQGFSIGVNDCFRYHKTNYILCINAPNKFSRERLDIIKNSRPEKFFAHNMEWKQYQPNFEFIGEHKLKPFYSGHIDGKSIYYSKTSPFSAISLARNMGAKTIILWGVDFKTHRHYSPGSGYLKAELKSYEFFIESLERVGTKVYQGCEGSELKLPVYEASRV